MKKRVLSLLLVVFMLVSLMPVGVLAEGETSGTYTDDNGVTYTLDNGVLTVSGDGECRNAWQSYLDAASVTKVVIGSGITDIGSIAFCGCTALTEIEVSTENADYVSVDGVVYSKDQSMIALYPEGKSGSFEIPDGVTTIRYDAFYDCAKLTSISIPSSVTSIQSFAFKGCTALTDVYYDGTCAQWNAISIADVLNECLTDATIHCTDATITGGGNSNNSYTDDNGITYTLYNGVLTISGEGQCGSTWQDNFDKAAVTEVITESGITSIGWDVFSGCTALESITIPDGVTIIGGFAFDGCSSLKSVTFPASVTDIYSTAFRGCSSLTSVVLPDGLDCISTSMFKNCSSLESITIPNSVTLIYDSAFQACTALTDVYYGGTEAQWNAIDIYENGNDCLTNATIYCTDATITGGGSESYTDDNGVTYTLNNGVLTVSGEGKCGSTWQSYFNKSAVTELVIEDGITSVGYWAFDGCTALESVTIPDSVTAIGDEAFKNCSSLTSISISANVTELSDCAFPYCSSLTAIEVSAENANYSSLDGVLYNKDQTRLYTCPAGKSGSLVIPDGVTYICSEGFKGCTALTSISIPGSLTSIAEGTFKGCTALADVTIGSGVTSIGRYAFDDTAYYNDEANWEDGVLYIDSYLIKAKDGLSGECSVKSGTRMIADYAFSYCKLANIIIPEGVTNIGYSAFLCGSFASITIPASVTEIGKFAFDECGSLTDVYYGGTCEQWNAIEIGDYNGYLEFATIHCTHNYTDVVTAPTCTEKGYTTHTCACGDVVVDTYVDALGHDTEIKNAKDATCTEAGYTGDEVCKTCGEVIKAGTVIAALGHDYTDVVTAPTCTEKGYTTHTCACGDVVVDTYVDALGHDTHTVGAKDATCTEAGYTGDEVCKTCGETISKGAEIAALGHDYTDVVTAPTCTEKGYTTHTCACGDVVVDTYVDALGHDYTDVVTAPTCTEKGYTTHTCTCGYSYVDNYVDELGHNTEIRNAKAATCTEAGYTGDEVCKTCGEVIKAGTVIAALGHDYTDVVTAPTCTEKGYTTHTCTCGYSYVDNYVDELGHNTEIRNAKDATCTEQGYTGDEVCKTCGETITKGAEIAALGHDYTDVVTAPTCTEKGYTTHTCACGDVVVDTYVDALGHSYTDVVTDPTCTKKGYTTHTCACGDSYKDNYVAALGHDYKDGYCTVCGAKDINFVDVADTAYYAEPVAWAVDNNITSGYGNDTFKPQEVCTRAQIVTFIWRANGCPEPAGTAHGFNDVVEGAYYYKAVLWAAEKNITGGYDDGGFHPDELVTRAQAMTFIWRAEGCPAVPEGTVNTFTDVPEGAYYHDAVLWAVANGITSGYDSTTFGSMDGCTRAQIVTFLYRDMAEE